MERPATWRFVLTLSAGIAAVSCGAVLIRMASAPTLAVAAYRMMWATGIMAPFTLRDSVRQWRRLTRRDCASLFLSGVALALHFALWIASLAHTSVASSVLLVNTTPFFIGLASQWFLRRPCGRSFWAGLSVAFLGCIIVFCGDWSRSADSMRGDFLALGGAVGIAVYLMIGASVRQKLSLLAYVRPVYGLAAVVLALAAAAAGQPLTGFPARTHFLMLLVGLVPQVIGHTAYNWSLRWLPPGLVALIALAEPVGASLLGYLILHETLTTAKVAGGCLILAGIYLAAAGNNRSK